MIQVRNSIFETNSSSTHCLTLYTKETWEKFLKGEYVTNCHYQEMFDRSEIDENDIFDGKRNVKEGCSTKWYDYDYFTNNGMDAVDSYYVLIEEMNDVVAISVSGYDN